MPCLQLEVRFVFFFSQQDSSLSYLLPKSGRLRSSQQMVSSRRCKWSSSDGKLNIHFKIFQITLSVSIKKKITWGNWREKWHLLMALIGCQSKTCSFVQLQSMDLMEELMWKILWPALFRCSDLLFIMVPYDLKINEPKNSSCCAFSYPLGNHFVYEILCLWKNQISCFLQGITFPPKRHGARNF